MSSIAIGTCQAGNVVLPKFARDTHMHVMGSSGAGKSYFLEHMLRRDILNSEAGVLLIDPHGELYDNLLDWMVTSDIRTNQLHLLDLTDTEYSIGFNPLVSTDRDVSRRVADMVVAFERVWGNETSETPRLRKCLRMTLYPLAVHNLSLLDANIFTSTQHKALRKKLVGQLPSKAFQDEWAEFDTYSDKEFREYFESTRTRIFEFVTAPAIRPIIGQSENVLDFKKCMDEGHVVLVKLGENRRVHSSEAHVLGALLTSELFAAAKQRDVGAAKYKPFYAYIDECADYLNEDIARSLDETRKFGLHFILSHQRLGQLLRVSPEVYDAVMLNAQTKVVFNIDDDETAETLCKQLFRADIDLEIPKEILNKPVAVGQEIITLFSSSKTEAESKSSGTSSMYGTGASVGESVFSPIEGSNLGTTESTGASSVSVSGQSNARASATGQTRGESETLRTIYEVMPTAVYSLDEMLHLGIVSIRSLPPRAAIIKLRGMKAVRMTTIDIRNRKPIEAQVLHFVRQVQKNSVFSMPQRDAEAHILARSQRLISSTGRVIDDSYDPDSFMD